MSHQTKLAAIAAVAAENLSALILENEADIQAAISKCAEETALQETEAKFAISFTVALNLDKSTQSHKLAWSVRNVRETSCQIPDPAQGTLPLAEAAADFARPIADGKFESVTISTGETSVTIDKEGAKKIVATAKALAKKK